jgi:hypothetical protein
MSLPTQQPPSHRGLPHQGLHNNRDPQHRGMFTRQQTGARVSREAGQQVGMKSAADQAADPSQLVPLVQLVLPDQVRQVQAQLLPELQ